MTVLAPLRHTLPAVVALALAVAGLTPTAAAIEPPPAPSTTVTLAPGGIAPTQQESNGYDLTSGGTTALNTAATLDVAPGLKLTNFQRLEPGGWNRGNILTADLSTPTLHMELRSSGTVASVEQTSKQLARTGGVAAINGDFFDMNASGAPVGIGADAKGLVNAPMGTRRTFTIEDGRAAIGALTTSGTLTAAGATTRLSGFNTPSIPKDGIGVYTPLWGTYPLDLALGGAESPTHPVVRATVVDGTVTQVRHGAGPADIPAGGQVVIGRDAGARTVEGLHVGDKVTVAVGMDRAPQLAVSGAEQLVVDGAVNPGLSDDAFHARTAIGVSKDGMKVIAMTIDGGTTASHGQRRVETAQLMRDLGAYEALMLDGGGSSTMLARVAGAPAPQLVNTPSDGSERPVSNSLVFTSTAAPTGVATSAQLRPVTTRAGAYTVLQGQHRTVFGSGLDANLAPVQDGGRFRATGSSVRLDSRMPDTAVATGVRPGQGDVTFALQDGRSATMPLTVLGPLHHLAADRTSLPFPDESGSATISLTGYDADGRPSPLEPRDVAVEADPGVRVETDGTDGWRVTPTTSKGAGLVRFRVGDHVLETAFTVGLDRQTLADFSDAAAWKPETARATATLAPAAGPTSTEHGLRMTYDFTTSTATRGAYAVPPTGIRVSGHPLALNLWIKGDGSGAWPRLQITSGNGTVSNLDGPMITWTGWQQARFVVPDGTATPIRVDKVRILETRPTAAYKGDITIAGLTADTAPVPPATRAEQVHDPVIVTNGTVDGRTQRIAVISDGQFVAREPGSALLANVRATLRQIVAAHPDHLVIDGDLVDEASPADLALAKKVLDEEVGSAFPWTYVPGNHEVMGGPLTNFTSVFGPAHTTKQLDHTRLITLNTSSGTLHGNGDGTAQLVELERQLQSAATDPRTTGVLVAMHMPMRDPLADKASQLSDRLEAQQLEDRLGRFRSQSGKSVAVVDGHVGVFHGSSHQGVSVVINGNSGKTPAGSVSDGGFRGWTMLGIEPSRGILRGGPQPPSERIAWLRAETHPAVDAVSLEAPARLAVGSTVEVAPTFRQGAATVPVAWPVSARYAGVGVQVVGDGASGEGGAGVVRWDVESRRLTAVRPGIARLTLTVGGVTAARTVVVTR